MWLVGIGGLVSAPLSSVPTQVVAGVAVSIVAMTPVTAIIRASSTEQGVSQANGYPVDRQ